MKNLDNILIKAFEENRFTKKIISKLKKTNQLDISPDYILKLRCKYNLSFSLLKNEYREVLCSALNISDDIHKLLNKLEKVFNVEDYLSLELIENKDLFPEEIISLYGIAKESIHTENIESKKQFLKILNEINNKYIFIYYPDFLREVYKAVFPSPFQKLKGLDKLNKTYKLLFYFTQKAYLEQELNHEKLLSIRISNIYPHLFDDMITGFKWKVSSLDKDKEECLKAANVDYGLGKGVWPKDKFPLSPFIKGCTCYVIPSIKEK